MRVLMCVLLLALAGCTQDSDPSGADKAATEQPPSATHGEESLAEASAEPPRPLAIVPCSLDEIPVMTGAGLHGATTTSCSFSDLSIPDGAASLLATFSWDAAVEYEDLGIKAQDTSDCTAQGGDGCELASAFGASPVLLRLDASDLEGRSWDDLRIYPAGFAAQPDWSLTLEFYATPSAPAA